MLSTNPLSAGTSSRSSARSARSGPAGLRRVQRVRLQPLAVQAGSTNGTGAPQPAAVAAPVPKDYRVSLFDAMKFNGPAPELINGRLAMIGLVAGAWEEANGAGQTLAQQAAALPLAELLLLGVWVYASLVPILKGAKMEAFGMFTPRAEITNGRAAMLAMAVLLLLEDKAGVPFF